MDCGPKFWDRCCMNVWTVQNVLYLSLSFVLLTNQAVESYFLKLLLPVVFDYITYYRRSSLSRWHCLPRISPQLTHIIIVNNWDVINLILWAYDLHNVHNIFLFHIIFYGMISRRLDQEQNQWTSEYYCSKRLPRDLAEKWVNDDFIDGTPATATFSQEFTCYENCLRYVWCRIFEPSIVSTSLPHNETMFSKKTCTICNDKRLNELKVVKKAQTDWRFWIPMWEQHSILRDDIESREQHSIIQSYCLLHLKFLTVTQKILIRY